MVITMVRPEGIWQSVDCRVTRVGAPPLPKDERTQKQLTIQCLPIPDPASPGGPRLLLGFCGLAEILDRLPTTRGQVVQLNQWMRETLRGENLTADQTLDQLRDRLTRDVGQSPLWTNAVTIDGAALAADGNQFLIQITNHLGGIISRTFTKIVERALTPAVMVSGSGRAFISGADVTLLQQQLGRRPRRWRDHFGLLAAINRRTAERAKAAGDSTISPWCQVSAAQPGRPGFATQDFTLPGEPSSPLGMSMLLGPIDVSEMADELMKGFQSGNHDPAETQAAGVRAVTRRP
jgi:hypothetical protein